MPIYEYQCEGCGQVLDALQKISDAPLKKCPSCGKPKLKRLLSAPMFLLKGSGWYETDFKKDHERKRNLAERPEQEARKEEGKEGADKKGSDAKEGADKKKEEKAQPQETAASAKEAKPESKPTAAARRRPARSSRGIRKAAPRKRTRKR